MFCLTALGASAATFGSGVQLTVSFTVKPNQALFLRLANGNSLTVTGSPVFTTSLYDGEILLGTYQSVLIGNSFSGKSFTAVFVSTVSPPVVSGYSVPPTVVPFTSLNRGTIAAGS